jgi:phosphoribosylglycinamide formyltransferase-1
MAERARVAVLISGSGTNMAALLYAAKAQDCPFEIGLVASNKADAGGLRLAEGEGLPTFVLSHKGMERTEHDAAMHAALVEAKADYVALAGYMRVLTPEFVRKWEGRMLNIHPSLLPKYKGLHTHQRALEAGDSHGGCSVHLVTAELDDGPVLGQTEVAILPGDTEESLAARVLIAEHQLYAKTLATYVSRQSDPEWIKTRLDSLASELPDTSFRTAHGSPAWRVGGDKSGKFFAIMFNRHHGEESVGVLVKTSGEDEMATLIDAEPDIYFRPAYYGPAGWIGIRLDRSAVDWDHVGAWLGRSWRSCAPKRLTKLMDAADEF